jgi:hypothetical protein
MNRFDPFFQVLLEAPETQGCKILLTRSGKPGSHEIETFVHLKEGSAGCSQQDVPRLSDGQVLPGLEGLSTNRNRSKAEK